jgi:hypothetical protein
MQSGKRAAKSPPAPQPESALVRWKDGALVDTLTTCAERAGGANKARR